MSLEKSTKIGGNHVTTEDHRVWMNCGVISRRIMEENKRRAWRESKGLRSTHQNPWAQIIKQATKEQLDKREANSDLEAIEYQTRRIHFSEPEIYHMGHENRF